jgi:lipoprotein NlpI
MKIFSKRRILGFSLAIFCSPLALWGEESLRTKQDLHALGVEKFFQAEITPALAAWDAYVKANPKDLPYHWQRGIALYYAERWADGRAQFEEHVKVNPEDVENSVWHFLCLTREKSLDEARKKILPVTKDARVPMSEILRLFRGTGSTAEVLAAAEAMPTEGDARRDALCYAHLYLGLFAEAEGKTEIAKSHLLKAAVDFSMPHYMGKVAKVHCQLRGWLPKPTPSEATKTKSAP